MFEDLDLNVDSYYAFMALYFLEDGIGRRKLSEKLGLSESKTRTMINHLRDEEVVESETLSYLSDRGIDEFQEDLGKIDQIEEIDLEEITQEGIDIAAKLNSVNPGNTVKVRDAAIRAGAKSLITLFHKGELYFPEGNPPKNNYIGKEDVKKIEKIFETGEDDVVIVSSAETLKEAKAGLWASLNFLIR